MLHICIISHWFEFSIVAYMQHIALHVQLINRVCFYFVDRMNSSKRKRVLTQNELEYLANHLSEISDISDLDEDNCGDSDDEPNAEESLDILDLGNADADSNPDEPLDIENMPIVVLEKENIDIEVLEYEGDEENDKTASKVGTYETRKRKALTENAANITKKKKGEKTRT